MKLKEIVKTINGKLKGDPEIEITGVSGISDVSGGDITFLQDKHFLDELKASSASAVLLKKEINDLTIAQIIVDNPLLSFAVLLKSFYLKPYKALGVMTGAFISDEVETGEDISIYPMTYLSKGVKLGSRVTIYPYVFIGENTEIGDDSILYPNVTVRENITIGKRAIIHSGAVIGSDGYGYIFDKGRHNKIPQVGGVVIEDDVEIGACTTIDRATTGNTKIGNGTKIDNLVQIAHNVEIGKNSLIISQVGIAGSSQIGDYVTLAGQVGVSDHTKVESGCIVGAKSGIKGTVSKGTYFGSPFALPHRQFLKAQALFHRLPEMNKKINELEKKIEEILSSIKT